jgi:hypothetical protein
MVIDLRKPKELNAGARVWVMDVKGSVDESETLRDSPDTSPVATTPAGLRSKVIVSPSAMFEIVARSR